MDQSKLRTLRLFARSLFANRVAGDDLVALILFDLEEKGEGAFQSTVDAFRRLIARWSMLSNIKATHELFSNAALVQAMGPPPPPARLALILFDVIGMSDHEIDEILAPLPILSEKLIQTERSDLLVPSKSTAVIFERETSKESKLRATLDELGVAIVGSASTPEQFFVVAKKMRPELLITDEVYLETQTDRQRMKTLQDWIDCIHISLTPDPDCVLSGEDIEPDVVVAKPYQPEVLRTVIAHSLQTLRAHFAD